MDRKSRNIVLYSVVCLVGVFLVGQKLESSYLSTVLLKGLMFLVIPYVINRFINKSKMSFSMTKSDIILMLIIAVVVIATIGVTYILIQNYLDVQLIKDDFITRMKLDNKTFIFAGLYTIFANSFVEEYFFRGFVFQGLLKKGDSENETGKDGHSKWLGAIFSSLLFAVYHLSIFISWFSLPILLLALFGLFLGGLVFAYFVYRTKSLIASYIIHLSADIGIVLVGVFGMKIFDIF